MFYQGLQFNTIQQVQFTFVPTPFLLCVCVCVGGWGGGGGYIFVKPMMLCKIGGNISSMGLLF